MNLSPKVETEFYFPDDVELVHLCYLGVQINIIIAILAALGLDPSVLGVWEISQWVVCGEEGGEESRAGKVCFLIESLSSFVSFLESRRHDEIAS